MDARGEKRQDELKVGLLTTAALLVLMGGLFFISDIRLTSGVRYLVSFNYLADLKDNALVKYAGGIEVGKVDRIFPREGRAIVELLVTDRSIRLRRDSEVVIYTAGLLGEKYVYIDADLGTGPELAKGEVLPGVDPPNLDQFFIQMGRFIDTVDRVLGDPKARASIQQSFDNFEKAASDLAVITAESRVQIRKVLADLSRTTGNADSVVASVQKLARSVDEISASLDKKDLNGAIRSFHRTMASLDSLALDVQKGKGTLGVLVKDEQVAKDLKALIEDLRRHPWKLLWKK